MAKDTITYSWDCRTVDCYPSYDDNTDVVYNVHWRVNATSSQLNKDDNPYTATVYGTQSLSVDDIIRFRLSNCRSDKSKISYFIS